MTENLVFGIRPVVEAIEAGKQIEKLYIRKGAEGQLMTELRDLCLRHRIRTQEVPRSSTASRAATTKASSPRSPPSATSN